MKPINKRKVQIIAALFVLPMVCTNVAAQAVETKVKPVVKVDKTMDLLKVVKPDYTAKTRLEPLTLKEILYSVGFRGQDLKEAWGTAMKESTGRPLAHNRNSNTGDNSYGLFQINMIGSLGPARLKQFGLKNNKELFDPYVNAKIAFEMSNGGKDWSAWHGLTETTKAWMQKFPK
jgi:hypothetical protein